MIKTGLCIDPIMSWMDPIESASWLVGGNVLLLALWLEVPLFFYLFSYGSLLALAGGLVCKITGHAMTVDVEGYFSEENMQKVATLMAMGVKKIAAVVLPVIFWEDMLTSIGTGVAIYVASYIFEWISLYFLALVALNAIFAYGKYSKEIDAAAAPHVAKAKALLSQYWDKIPRHTATRTAGRKSE